MSSFYQMENITLPLKRGNMEDIDLGETSSSQTADDDSTPMEVDGSSSQVSSKTTFSQRNPLELNCD